MTPEQRLLKAADLLDKRASGATQGPWVMGGIGDFGWSVYAEDFAGNFSIETEDSEQGKADARYIATMHPEVGKAVAKMLRVEAEMTTGDGDGWSLEEALVIADLVLAGGDS